MEQATEVENKLLVHQCELERLFNKNQTIPRIRKEFQEAGQANFSEYIQAKGIPLTFGLDLLVQMALHKRASISILVGILHKHFNTPQETVDMLLKAAEADLIDWCAITEHFIVKFTISDDVQEELDRFQFPLPMVVPPAILKKNTDSGYILSNSSVILRNNHHEDDVCLDHVNRMNAIKFTINMDTAKMIKNRWKNLDKAKEGESRAEFQRRVKAFAKYNRTALEVMELITVHGNEFYLTHRYDKRGRVYCQGYHVNYQGTAWNKAVVELAEKELVDG